MASQAVEAIAESYAPLEFRQDKYPEPSNAGERFDRLLELCKRLRQYWNDGDRDAVALVAGLIHKYSGELAEWAKEPRDYSEPIKADSSAGDRITKMLLSLRNNNNPQDHYRVWLKIRNEAFNYKDDELIRISELGVKAAESGNIDLSDHYFLDVVRHVSGTAYKDPLEGSKYI